MSKVSFSRKMAIGGVTIIYDGFDEALFVTPNSHILSDPKQLLFFCEQFPEFNRACREEAQIHGLLPKS